MTRRKRMAGGAIGLVVALVAVWAVFSLAANGQDGIPQSMPRIPSTPIAPSPVNRSASRTPSGQWRR